MAEDFKALERREVTEPCAKGAGHYPELSNRQIEEMMGGSLTPFDISKVIDECECENLGSQCDTCDDEE